LTKLTSLRRGLGCGDAGIPSRDEEFAAFLTILPGVATLVTGLPASNGRRFTPPISLHLKSAGSIPSILPITGFQLHPSVGLSSTTRGFLTPQAACTLV
jgi:hypothetical protein